MTFYIDINETDTYEVFLSEELSLSYTSYADKKTWILYASGCEEEYHCCYGLSGTTMTLFLTSAAAASFNYDMGAFLGHCKCLLETLQTNEEKPSPKDLYLKVRETYLSVCGAHNPIYMY